MKIDPHHPPVSTPFSAFIYMLKFPLTFGIISFGFLSCTYIPVSGWGTVTGAEAKRKLTAAISSQASIATFLNLSGISSGGSCGSGDINQNITENESNGNDSFQEAYLSTQNKVLVPGINGAIITYSGTIDSNNEYDFIYIYSNVSSQIDVLKTGGLATCGAFYGFDYHTNNTTEDARFGTPDNIGHGLFDSGPSLTDNDEIFIRCTGTTSQTYTILVTDQTPISPTTPNIASPSNISDNAFLASYIFLNTEHIDTSKTYTRESVDACLSEISKKGPLITLYNAEAKRQATQCGKETITIDRNIMLGHACKLEQAKIIQLGDAGFP
ncbi:hypothetical protein EHQ27_17830 [Leptospira wolffii]|uniref:hypothetical protein n=1 Tax=Leptospira wolffii TaxID=409998 RepID=UPI00108479D4|nr:hypothetical protein [Leptospira wolffii]TGK62516.1 hypothetical protein EHQ32_06785 [Leptospira wolffii]TGK66059.1 hypothetical protein EHQ27_17830 [Leptospira wolffii]TGK74099.1 hypothetical protein EHQ35_06985 [Leptospira wolffii]TGL28958.1 hypothetical protein EHQ57_13505 [Leptospira wolffii]